MLRRAITFVTVERSRSTERTHSHFCIEKILFNRLGSILDNEAARLFLAPSRRSRGGGRARADVAARTARGARARRDRAGLAGRTDVAPDRRRVRDAGH